MKNPKRNQGTSKHLARAGIAAALLTLGTATPAVSATPAATSHILAHPPVTGDCASCHPKPPVRPKRGQ